MKIEIAEPGRMTQTGSSLLKLIQNNNMPILDLLVRESIQNSLDAKNGKDNHVLMEFNTGSFIAKDLNVELDGITEQLNKKYKNEQYEYITISDSNTFGLTGKLHYSEVTDNNYGNLLKLIYEISKPQDAEGAGGSWGLGKTVYFRVGIGLVIYYSRINIGANKYESRLAASLVEDESKPDSLIPILNNKSKRGIAWWGEEIGRNRTKPITNEKYINKVLSIFGVKPYSGNNTGTTIIIPYIDSEKLLKHNLIEYLDSGNKKIAPFWEKKLDDYFKIAVQRWYAPRLNNTYYPYGPYLRAKINGNRLTNDSMEPIFKVIQGLYNRAVTKSLDIDDILNTPEATTKIEQIILRKVMVTSDAGIIAYTKINKNVLNMNYPNNKPTPYIYFNHEQGDKDLNKPVISFTRMPGMIVSYETMGVWADGIMPTNLDEYIVGIFVLNSNNKLVDDSHNTSLEEYVRRSEMADHTSWNDFSLPKMNPRIISKIQNHVKSKISKEFATDKNDTTTRFNSGLGKLFGEMLLPPEDFGKAPSSRGKNPIGDPPHIENHRNLKFTVEKNNIRYSNLGIEIVLYIETIKKIKQAIVNVGIDSESGSISANDWEEKMGIKLPFTIDSSEVSLLKYDELGEKELKKIALLNNIKQVDTIEDLKVSMLRTHNSKSYGIKISSDIEHSYKAQIRMKLRLEKRNFRPTFNIESKTGDN